MKQNKDIKDKIIRIVLLALYLLAFIVVLASCQTKASLERRICRSLKEKYGMDFACESVGVYGGEAFFVCYPVDDPTLHFDGDANSETGGVGEDTFIGAIFAKNDAALMTEALSAELGEVYVFGIPMHHGLSNANQVIQRDNYSLKELERETSMSPNLKFIIFINTTDELFTDNSGHDYDSISYAVDTLVKYYENNYDYRICVDMQIYYVNNLELDYVKDYFKTNLSTGREFVAELNYQNCISLQMGPEDNGYYYDTLRLTRDEYINERELRK